MSERAKAGGWNIWMGARALFAACCLALAAGCATTGAGDPRDPFEGFNRSMYAFNEAFDDAIAKPVATAYRTVAPEPVRGWVRNFFANLGDVFIGLNNLLQGKPLDAATDWARFAFNSVFGVLGINDVASEMGLEKHNEDFGQTLGRWGVGDGPYIVLPLLGPRTLRDSVGTVFDTWLDPVRRHEPEGVRTFGVGLRATGQRTDLLDASRILEEAALDKYIFQRDAYLQRRRGLIYDGSPPREPSSQRTTEEPRARAAEPGGVANAAPSALPAGVMPSTAPVHSANQYEPREPANYEAVLAAERAAR